MAGGSMWDKILLVTLITVFFPWSVLVMLWFLGWDETVRVFREIVIETVGLTAFVISAAVMILLAVGVVALVIALVAR
jgi:hypothetical protein